MFSNLVSIVRGQAKHRDVEDQYGVLIKNLYSSGDEKYKLAVEELLVLVRERDDILARIKGDFSVLVDSLEKGCEDLILDILYESLGMPGGVQAEDQTSLDPEIKAIYAENADVFLHQGHFVRLISLLDESRSNLTFGIVNIISLFLKPGKLDKLQQVLLSEPMLINKICELLRDKREIVRNESLLLIKKICEENQAIQKIIVFENAFELIFKIILEEGLDYGAVLAEDGLDLIKKLLANDSNRNYFRETQCVEYFPSIFELIASSSDKNVDSKRIQKITGLVLEILESLLNLSGKDLLKTKFALSRLKPPIILALLKLAEEDFYCIPCLAIIFKIFQNCSESKEAFSAIDEICPKFCKWIENSDNPMVISLSLNCLNVYLDENRIAQERQIGLCTSLFRTHVKIMYPLMTDSLKTWCMIKVIRSILSKNQRIRNDFMQAGVFQELLKVVLSRMKSENISERRVEIGMLCLLNDWMEDDCESIKFFVSSSFFDAFTLIIDQLPLTDVILKGLIIFILCTILETALSGKSFGSEISSLLNRLHNVICVKIGVQNSKKHLQSFMNSSEIQKSLNSSTENTPHAQYLQGLNLFDEKIAKSLVNLIDRFESVLLKLYTSEHINKAEPSTSKSILPSPSVQTSTQQIFADLSLQENLAHLQAENQQLKAQNSLFSSKISQLESQMDDIESLKSQLEQCKSWQDRYLYLESQYIQLQNKHQTLLLLLAYPKQ